VADSPDSREDQIEKAVRLLRGKTKKEREEYMVILDLTPAEKAEVRRRLQTPTPSPFPPSPEELRQLGSFNRLVQDGPLSGGRSLA
jgi:hypothetical protein